MKKINRCGILLCVAISFLLVSCDNGKERIATYSSDEQLSGEETSDSAAGTEPVTLKPEADFILPESDSRLYSQNELKELSPEQLRIARNEIYARHGRQFKDNTLNEYFRSKTWYEGNVESDKFHEESLNRTERDNISLLLRLEQEAQHGRTGYDAAPYAGIFAAWDRQHENRKVCEKLFPDGTGNVVTSEHSRVISHELYYEVTDCSVYVDEVYDSSLFEGKKQGDSIVIDGDNYILTELKEEADGYRSCMLNYVQQDGHFPELTPQGRDARRSLKECSEGFYEKTDNDIYAPVKLIYEGSLYFYRDARIEVGMMGGQKVITAQEYFEIPAPEQEITKAGEYTRMGGLQQDGFAWLLGIPQYDSNYYFTEFKETSRNWVG